jgi:hypothetical protein
LIRLAEASGRMNLLWQSEQLHDDRYQQEPCFMLWSEFARTKRQDIWLRMSRADRRALLRDIDGCSHTPDPGWCLLCEWTNDEEEG